MKNFKFLLVVSIMITASVAFFVKCQKEAQKTTISEYEVVTYKASLATGTKYVFECTGSGCTGSSVCVGSWNAEDNFFDCCSGCYIEVTIGSSPVADAQSAISEVKAKNAYYDDLASFIYSKHSSINFGILEMSYGKQGDCHMFMFEYKTSDGDIGTVSYHTDEEEEKTIRVDCHGGCSSGDCKERMIFSDPPSIECTCEDNNCVMDITTLN